MSNGFARAASEKKTELEAVMAKRKCLEGKMKCLQEILILNIFLHI